MKLLIQCPDSFNLGQSSSLSVHIRLHLGHTYVQTHYRAHMGTT